MIIFRRTIFFFPALFTWGLAQSQANTYILNGSASQNTCNCYTLTPAANTQSGSVWNATRINLNDPFDFVFNVFLGCNDANGADGIVFMLQPISTSVGTTGEGMGFEGISPSIGISLDTWQNVNRNDPAYDHISIQSNGNITHGTDLAGPVQASAAVENIEDCQWHTFRIVWDPATRILGTYFDGVFRIQASIDLVATLFNNDPLVYWGFSAGTGGANNLQQFCTALNPGFTTNHAGNATCIGNTVTFTNTSESFAPIASFYWDFGDGTTSTAANPPPHLYNNPGNYEVLLAITGLDGCFSDTLRKTVSIGDFPVADFDIFDTCAGIAPRIIESSSVNVGTISQWNWKLDGNPVSVSQLPQLGSLTPGGHQLSLTVSSSNGCPSQELARSFATHNLPAIQASGSDGCSGQPVSFTADQLDNATFITGWSWDFGDGQQSSVQNPMHVFQGNGNFEVEVQAMSSDGCYSNTVDLSVSIQTVYAHAGNDTTVIRDMPFRLQSSYGATGTTGLPQFNWEPPQGLDDPGLMAPTAILQDDQTYYFTVTSSAGCVARDTVHLAVFKGSAVYVPSGFTPNNDGRNDRLKPSYIGIRSLDFFRVYNRWGQLLFSTRDMGAGWDGSIQGTSQPSGTCVWMLQATDFAGKVYKLKGTTTIIR